MAKRLNQRQSKARESLSEKQTREEQQKATTTKSSQTTNNDTLTDDITHEIEGGGLVITGVK